MSTGCTDVGFITGVSLTLFITARQTWLLFNITVFLFVEILMAKQLL